MDKICRMVEKKLLEHIEGKLPADENQSIVEHRKTCEKCNYLIKRFNEIWTDIPKMERLKPFDSFWTGLQAKIQEVESPHPLSDRIFTGLKMTLRPAALILTLLAGLYFGYQMGNITDDHKEISLNNAINTDESGRTFVENYLQDFQEILAGSPGEFYLQTEFYKKE